MIGLLLAEYRRRRFDERAVYLCPTRQLAHQVAGLARTYGIPAHALLPPDYRQLNEYRLGRSVGVATYSALFNTNPKVADPQVIVLDDAHSSVDYIADMWSVGIS